MSNNVEALSWDITLGVATTGLGRLILSKTSDSKEDAPEAIDHVGLKVFGNLYEYGDLGILKTELEEGVEVKSKYPAYSLRSVESVGETSRTLEEFEQWVEEQNAGEFQGSNYNLVTTSCVIFGIKGAEFLGVPHPENWDKIVQWASRNEGFTSVVGQSGLAARYLQHKAEEYIQNPEKIKEKAKKLYKRLRRKKRAAVLAADGVTPPQDGEGEEASDDDEEDDDDSGSNDENVDNNNEFSTIME